MSDKIVKQDKIFFSLDGSMSYKISDLRDFYINSFYNIGKISEIFKIDKLELEQIAIHEEWGKARIQNREHIISNLQNRVISTAQEELDLQLQATELAHIQNLARVKKNKEYFDKHGHLFLVDKETGEVVHDTYGQPIPIKLAVDIKDSGDKIKNLTFIQGLTKIISEAANAEFINAEISSPNGAKTIDASNNVNIDEYQLFLPAAEYKKED